MSNVRPIPPGNTTLDWLKVQYPWLSEMLAAYDENIIALRRQLADQQAAAQKEIARMERNYMPKEVHKTSHEALRRIVKMRDREIRELKAQLKAKR